MCRTPAVTVLDSGRPGAVAPIVLRPLPRVFRPRVRDRDGHGERPPPRTVQQDYALGPMVALEVGDYFL
jgi:hypothetical protein